MGALTHPSLIARARSARKLVSTDTIKSYEALIARALELFGYTDATWEASGRFQLLIAARVDPQDQQIRDWLMSRPRGHEDHLRRKAWLNGISHDMGHDLLEEAADLIVDAMLALWDRQPGFDVGGLLDEVDERFLA